MANPALSIATLSTCITLLCIPAYAGDTIVPPKKWGGHIEVEAKKGNQRTLGESELFFPLKQDEDSMIFIDLRGVADNKSSREGNVGIGYRKMLDKPFLGQKWIAGGYGFADLRRTPNNNSFFQATVGAEFLSEKYDFRVNTYIPQNSEKNIKGTSNVSGFVSGTQLRINGTGNQQERALPGIDAEVGVKLPIFENYISSIRAYGGGFYFNADGYEKISGPRGRLEVSWDNVPLFGDNSRFTLGGEIQHDDVRGRTAFGLARLRVPLQKFKNTNKNNRSLTDLEKRMTESIVRDVDIVSNTRIGNKIDEAATISINGQQITNATVLDATDDVPVGVTGAGAGSTVIIDGSKGQINPTAGIVFEDNQTITGGGIEITGTQSGFKGVIGTRPTIDDAGIPIATETISGTNAASNYTLQNLDVISGGVGDSIDMVGNDVIIKDVNSTGGNSAIIVDASNSASIDNVTVDASTIGIVLSGTPSFSINNSSITDTTSFSYLFVNSSGSISNSIATNAGSDSFAIFNGNFAGTNNVSINPTNLHCNNFGGATGSFELNGGTCP